MLPEEREVFLFVAAPSFLFLAGAVCFYLMHVKECFIQSGRG